jgi:hypothetical protein
VQRRYCLRVRAPLASSVLADVRRRFGVVDVAAVAGLTEIRVALVDEAALRALLDVVWDANAEVVGLALETVPPAQERPAVLRSGPGHGP